jgi:UDP-N-acetyl-D-glucosamine dehydrogenase
MVLTDHDKVDYAVLVANAKLIVDTRNACRNITSGHIVRA